MSIELDIALKSYVRGAVRGRNHSEQTAFSRYYLTLPLQLYYNPNVVPFGWLSYEEKKYKDKRSRRQMAHPMIRSKRVFIL